MDTPEIDIQPEDHDGGWKRRRMSPAEVLAEFDRKYASMATFIEGLVKEQFARKSYISMLTLALLAGGRTNFHVGFHIDHMCEIAQACAFWGGVSRKVAPG